MIGIQVLGRPSFCEANDFLLEPSCKLHFTFALWPYYGEDGYLEADILAP